MKHELTLKPIRASTEVFLQIYWHHFLSILLLCIFFMFTRTWQQEKRLPSLPLSLSLSFYRVFICIALHVCFFLWSRRNIQTKDETKVRSGRKREGVFCRTWIEFMTCLCEMRRHHQRNPILRLCQLSYWFGMQAAKIAATTRFYHKIEIFQTNRTVPNGQIKETLK